MNGKIIAYKTVSGREPREFEQAVNGAILDGWEPIGGPVLLPAPQNTVFVVQAMVMRESLISLAGRL
jgi:hypothetical protein